MLNSKKRIRFATLLIFKISALLVATPLLMSACNGRDEIPEKPLEPLTSAQSDQFNALIDSLGRPEQVVRVLKSFEPGWGASDPVTNTIITAMNSKDCKVTIDQTPDGENKFKRIFTVTGTTCPLQLLYELKQKALDESYSLTASYLLTDETLARANGLRGATISWKGRITSTATNSRLAYRWNFSGSGKMTLAQGNQELSFQVGIDMQEINGLNEARQSGRHFVNLWGLETPITMLAEYSVTSQKNDSRFRINGTTISKAAFDNYISRLGFLAGFGEKGAPHL